MIKFKQWLIDQRKECQRESEKYLEKFRVNDGNQLSNLCLHVGFAAKEGAYQQAQRELEMQWELEELND